MVVTTAGSLDESNGESGKPLHSGQMVMNLLNDVILDMVQEELIDRLLYEAFSLPIYMRNKAELVAPFIDRQNDLSRAFSLEYGQIQKMSCPFYEELQDTHDRKKYAHSLCNTVRAFTEPMLIKGLFPSSCPREVIERTTSEIYARMEQAVESDPDRYKFDVVQLVAVLARN